MDSIKNSIIVGDCMDALRDIADGSVNACVTSPPYFGLRDYGVDGQIGLEATPAEYMAKLVAVFSEVRRVLRDDGTLWLNLGDSYANTGGKQQAQQDVVCGGIGLKKGSRGTQPCSGCYDGVTRPASVGVGGIKPKDLIGIPWRVAFALQDDGWWLRQDIIWHKPNPMPESVRDRCTKAHEYVFLLSKSERYYFDADAIAEPASYAERHRTVNDAGATAFAAGDNHFRTRVGLTVKKPRATRNRRSVWTPLAV